MADKRKIPFMVPQLGEPEAKAAAEAVLSGWVTQGPRVAEFERVFCDYTGSQFACAVANCTCALHLALLAAGVGPGDVVITASHSYIATANAIRYCGAEPVFVDIDPATYNLDPDLVERCLREDFEERDGGYYYTKLHSLISKESPLFYQDSPRGRLAAIEVVHQVGMPADLARLLPLAQEFGVPVVEDAAPALGSKISFDQGQTWEPIGRPHGQSACFSFHPRKLITTGDGGMITTDHPEIDKLVRLLRQHGMSVPDLARHQADQVIIEQYVQVGFNYRLSDIQAAVGIEQMKRLEDIVGARRRLAGLYREALNDAKGLRLPGQEPPYARTTWQSYVVVVSDVSQRNQVMNSLLASGINARRGTMAAHLEPPYAKTWPLGSLPHSEKASLGGITLPLFPSMSTEEVDYVAQRLLVALGAKQF